MIIAGFDYSITGPSLCIHSGSSFSIDNCLFYFLSDTKKYHKQFLNGKINGHAFAEYDTDERRFDVISDFFLKVMYEHKPITHVGIEGYAFAAKGKVFHIAENTGLLKHKIYKKDIPLTVFAPSQVKNAANRKGNCAKDEMFEAFKEETSIDLITEMEYSKTKIDSPIADIIDSYYVTKKLWSHLND